MAILRHILVLGAIVALVALPVTAMPRLECRDGTPCALMAEPQPAPAPGHECCTKPAPEHRHTPSPETCVLVPGDAVDLVRPVTVGVVMPLAPAPFLAIELPAHPLLYRATAPERETPQTVVPKRCRAARAPPVR